MAKGLWTVEAGRGICWQGIRKYSLQRVVDPVTESSTTTPTEADETVGFIVRLLNEAAEKEQG